jgi:hypothetical protein
MKRDCLDFSCYMLTLRHVGANMMEKLSRQEGS